MPRVKRAPSRRATPKRKAARSRTAAKRPQPAAAGGVRGLARRLDLARTTVKDALEAGRCPKATRRAANGQWEILDEDLAVREWFENAAKPSPASAPAAGGSTTAPQDTLAEENRRVAEQRRIKLRLENEVRQGQLLDRAAEERKNFERARTVRDAMVGIPDRVAPEFPPDIAERLRRRLSEEIRAALAALADALAPGEDDERRSRDGGGNGPAAAA